MCQKKLRFMAFNLSSFKRHLSLQNKYNFREENILTRINRTFSVPLVGLQVYSAEQIATTAQLIYRLNPSTGLDITHLLVLLILLTFRHLLKLQCFTHGSKSTFSPCLANFMFWYDKTHLFFL